jgi:ribosomal protein S18 acetylase RimI-like enzyme
MTLAIRRAMASDLPQLLDLYRHLNPDDEPASLADARTIFAQFAGQPGNIIFAGFIGEELVTSCTLVTIPNLTRRGTPYALIENVVTHEDHRRAGHGCAVLKAAADAAWQAGCYKAMLMTGRNDPGTLAFYRRAGFEQSKTGFQIRRPQTTPLP